MGLKCYQQYQYHHYRHQHHPDGRLFLLVYGKIWKGMERYGKGHGKVWKFIVKYWRDKLTAFGTWCLNFCIKCFACCQIRCFHLYGVLDSVATDECCRKQVSHTWVLHSSQSIRISKYMENHGSSCKIMDLHFDEFWCFWKQSLDCFTDDFSPRLHHSYHQRIFGLYKNMEK